MKTLFLMVGISGSGKSVFSTKLAEALSIERHSSDDIRAEICNGDATDQSKNNIVFRILEERAQARLNAGKSVIVDATSVKPRDRKAFRQIALMTGAQVVAIVMTSDFEEATKYNAERARVVPQFVLEKQFNALVPPTLEEVSEIWYVRWTDDTVSIQRPNQFEFEYFNLETILNYGREQIS